MREEDLDPKHGVDFCQQIFIIFKKTLPEEPCAHCEEEQRNEQVFVNADSCHLKGSEGTNQIICFHESLSLSSRAFNIPVNVKYNYCR